MIENLGISDASIEVGIGLPDLEDVPAFAQRVERAGFDYLSSGEHIFFHGPTPNSLVALAAAASVTERIGLLSAIALAPLYPPALLAKMASVLDHVSGGRFHLGVGVGGENPREFEAVGVPLAQRGRRTDEALEVIRQLFTSERVSFHGQWTSFEEVALDPRPVRKDGPPIWVAGRSEAAMRRAGRFADVWMPYMYTPEQLVKSIVEVRRQAEAHGRNPDAVRATLHAFICVDEDGDLARKTITRAVGQTYKQDFSRLAHYLIAGTAEECVARIAEYAQAGARCVQLNLGCPPDQQDRVLQTIEAHVLPSLR